MSSLWDFDFDGNTGYFRKSALFPVPEIGYCGEKKTGIFFIYPKPS
jgi:hypothetical protein